MHPCHEAAHAVLQRLGYLRTNWRLLPLVSLNPPYPMSNTTSEDTWAIRTFNNKAKSRGLLQFTEAPEGSSWTRASAWSLLLVNSTVSILHNVIINLTTLTDFRSFTEPNWPTSMEMVFPDVQEVYQRSSPTSEPCLWSSYENFHSQHKNKNMHSAYLANVSDALIASCRIFWFKWTSLKAGPPEDLGSKRSHQAAIESISLITARLRDRVTAPPSAFGSGRLVFHLPFSTLTGTNKTQIFITIHTHSASIITTCRLYLFPLVSREVLVCHENQYLASW